MIKISKKILPKFLIFSFLFIIVFGCNHIVNAAFSDGTEDVAFYTNLGSSFYGDIRSIVVQPDGKILTAGWFNLLNGSSRKSLVRLNADGTQDVAFYNNLGSGFDESGYFPNGTPYSYPSGLVSSVARQSDGKILVGGGFTTFNSNSRNRLVRLNSDGTEDVAFYNNLNNGFQDISPTFRPSINSIRIQNDNKIIVTSHRSFFNNRFHKGIVRLNPDGTEDFAFDNNLSISKFNNSVYTAEIDSSGKILISGSYNMTRLNPNGTEDIAFYNNLGSGFGPKGEYLEYPRSIFIQSDNKILVAGSFTTFNGKTRNRLVRLNPSGTEDVAFYNNLGSGFNGTIGKVFVQSDNKILVAGSFTNFNGQPRNRLVRLNPDGTEDVEFYTNLLSSFNDGYIYTLVLEDDGDILVGGSFTRFKNQNRKALVKLTCCSVTEPPTLSLSATPTNVPYNGATNLTWSSTNATSCTASGGWSGNKSPNGGSQIVSSLKQETTFTMSCTGTGGTVEQSVTVTVNAQAPIVNLSALPVLVASGSSTELTWTVLNAISCTASGGWSGAKFAGGGNQVITNITNNTEFTLTCKNAQNVETTASVSVSVILPINVTLIANPVKVQSGGSTQIAWATTNSPTNCTASGGWSGNKALSGSQIFTINTDTVFTLTCTKGNQTASASAEVTVTQPLNITLSATPNPLAKGGNVNLSWNRDNADTCTASSIPAGIWSGIKPPTLNTETVNNLQQNTTFTISCTKNGINGSDSKTVTLIAVPEITISANPTSILSGGSTVITWSVTNNPDTCIASNGWSGSKNTNGGNETINNITQNTTFTLACQKGDINIVHSVSVSVIQENISFSNTRVLQGQTTLRWTVTNMKECVATTENPDNGLGWEGPKTSSPSPYTGQTTNVSVTAPDTTDVSLKNRYILTCTGVTSNVKQSKMLSLDINDPASSGVGIPVYQEN